MPTVSEMDDSVDRMILRLDPGGPIDLAGLGSSFAALARIYARHHGETDDEETTPRLFISRLENGSVIAEIVPYVVLFGQAVQFADSSMVVSDFTRRIGQALKAFSGQPLTATELPAPLPSAIEDARDIREFVRPLTGRRGAELKFSHARFEHRDGDKHTVLEYRFDEAELNRAALNIDSELGARKQLELDGYSEKLAVLNYREVFLFMQQASRAAGRDGGRTSDRAIVPSISPKALPVWFQKDAGDLKAQMIEENALKATFVVDLEVQTISGEPRGYLVKNVHRAIAGD